AEERGMTVLVSSHNLPELFQTATDYLIVEGGELRLTLTLDELEAQTQQYLEVAASDTAALLTALEEAWPEASPRVMPGGTVRLPHHAEQAEQVLRALAAADVWPAREAREGESLEAFFLSVVGGESSWSTCSATTYTPPVSAAPSPSVSRPACS